MATARRTTMRERPVNITKKLQVIHSDDDPRLKELSEDAPKLESVVPVADKVFDVSFVSWFSCPVDLIAHVCPLSKCSLLASQVSDMKGVIAEKKPEVIPVPPVRPATHYGELLKTLAPFQLPPHYVMLLISTFTPASTQDEYHLTHWLCVRGN